MVIEHSYGSQEAYLPGLVNKQFAIENGHKNSGWLPSYKMVDLSSSFVVNVETRPGSS